jgi:hypothetical protein
MVTITSSRTEIVAGRQEQIDQAKTLASSITSQVHRTPGSPLLLGSIEVLDHVDFETWARAMRDAALELFEGLDDGSIRPNDELRHPSDNERGNGDYADVVVYHSNERGRKRKHMGRILDVPNRPGCSEGSDQAGNCVGIARRCLRRSPLGGRQAARQPAPVIHVSTKAAP